MLDALRNLIPRDADRRREELEAELRRIEAALAKREAMLAEKRESRLKALFPEGPVPGAGPRRFPELDPVNFEEKETQSWLVSLATRIIDNFPGSEALLSQLDNTLHAFSEANHYRVVPGGPWEELLTWRDEILRAWDLDREVPIYVSQGGRCRVLGCSSPFVVADRSELSALDEDERRFVLAVTLGNIFFGNLKIFAFHKLMETLDKLPSMGGLITRGLGMLPFVGNTISRGIELARSVNNQVIRKTNLVVGMRQNMLCDRLAILALGDVDPAQRFFAKQVLGDEEGEALRPRLIEQGRTIHERFERGEVDLHMLSVVGPTAAFAAYRAYRLDAWVGGDEYRRVRDGYYVTRTRLAEYQRTHRALEEEISFLESRVLELHEKQTKLQTELSLLDARRAAAHEEEVL